MVRPDSSCDHHPILERHPRRLRSYLPKRGIVTAIEQQALRSVRTNSYRGGGRCGILWDRRAVLAGALRTAVGPRMEHYLKEWTEELRDGTGVVIRPIRPDDGPGIEAFIGSLSPQSKHLLFLGGVARLPKAELERLCRADYAHDMGYVAVPAGEANATPVGLVRYASTDPAAGAEISVA